MQVHAQKWFCGPPVYIAGTAVLVTLEALQHGPRKELYMSGTRPAFLVFVLCAQPLWVCHSGSCAFPVRAMSADFRALQTTALLSCRRRCLPLDCLPVFARESVSDVIGFVWNGRTLVVHIISSTYGNKLTRGTVEDSNPQPVRSL